MEKKKKKKNISWDLESFTISLGNEVYFSRTYRGSLDVSPQNLCGVEDRTTAAPSSRPSWWETVHRLEVYVPHLERGEFNLTLGSTLNQQITDESWGFREFELSFGRYAESRLASFDFWSLNFNSSPDWRLLQFQGDSQSCSGVRLLGGPSFTNASSRVLRLIRLSEFREISRFDLLAISFDLYEFNR